MHVFADFEQYSGNFRQELLLFSWDFPFSETGFNKQMQIPGPTF